MDYKKWPEGVGLDLAFWDDRDLWSLRDAAAISLGIDPRVYHLFTLDPSFHGGPKLLMHAMPELLAKIEYLSVMANHGTLPAFKGEKGWHVRPSDYHAFMEGMAATTPPTPTTEPGHDQQVEDQEPTDAAPYVAWRRKKIRSIHDGQLMLEVQDRWGRPPKKTMDRADIAALVLGEDPPSPNDTSRRRSLENTFKNTTKVFKVVLKE